MSLYVDGELPVVATSGNCNNSGMFGNNGDWIWAFLLLALLGNGGWGFGGNGGVGSNYVLATDFATIERKLDGVNNGLCDGFYAQNTNMLNGFASVQNALCQGFNGLQQTVMQGFHGVDNAVCTLGYNTQAGFNSLANQIASCCCDLKTMNLENRYLNEKQTCDVINASNANTRAILDYLTGEKIDTLNRKLAVAENEALTYKNNAYLISQIKEPCAIPAYITPNPNCCYNYGVVPYSNCGGCASVQ